MNPELQRAIKARKKEAKDKKIVHKAFIITQYLGSPRITPLLSSELVVKSDQLTVIDRSNDAYKDIAIFFHGRCVFQYFADDVRIYIPSEWEKKFNETFNEALEKKAETEKKSREEEQQIQEYAEKVEREKWDL